MSILLNRKSVSVVLAVLLLAAAGFMANPNVLAGNIYMAGFFRAAERSAPTCVSGFDLLWGDSTAHREKVCDNNGSPVQLVHSGGDVNTSDQVTGWNGGAAPSSATVIGTNGSKQPTATSTEGNGSKVQLTNAGTTTGGDAASYDASGNVQDSGKALPSGNILGDTAANTFTFGCSGTATANSPGLFMPGDLDSTKTCTLTSNPASIGKLTAQGGTLKHLHVVCGTAGVNASSGVFTVLQATSATTLTCTLGTTTFCQDDTHTASVGSGGTSIQIKFTTQIGETAANCGASVQID